MRTAHFWRNEQLMASTILVVHCLWGLADAPAVVARAHTFPTRRYSTRCRCGTAQARHAISAGPWPPPGSLTSRPQCGAYAARRPAKDIFYAFCAPQTSTSHRVRAPAAGLVQAAGAAWSALFFARTISLRPPGALCAGRVFLHYPTLNWQLIATPARSAMRLCPLGPELNFKAFGETGFYPSRLPPGGAARFPAQQAGFTAFKTYFNPKL